MSRNRKTGRSLTEREAKAAALDDLVKKTLSDARVKDAAKTARLRALRLAKEAADKETATRSRNAKR